MEITSYEKKHYVLKDKKDFAILSIIKKLENNKLTKGEKGLVKLARTQLKRDWRAPLVAFLKNMHKISLKRRLCPKSATK